MELWKCEACGHVYDPNVSDADSGPEAGTPFEEHPADWVCPECGATKDQFIKEERPDEE